jgi:hypothetical protein
MMKNIPNWISYLHDFSRFSSIDIYFSRVENSFPVLF